MTRKQLAATGKPNAAAPADTDLRAIADSTNISAGCCKKLTHDEIYEILTQCR